MLHDLRFPTRRYGAALTAMTLSAVVNCGGELPSPSLVNKLRLLAIVADRPEVAASAPTDVHIEAVWFDGKQTGNREIFFLWRLCAEGADQDPRNCLTPHRGTDLAVGPASAHGDRVVITSEQIPHSPVMMGESRTTYIVMVAICPLSAPVYDSGTGQYVCPSEEKTPNAEREGIQAVRRIVVKSAPPLNTNPTIAKFEVDNRDVLAPDAVTFEVKPCHDSDKEKCSFTVAVTAAQNSTEKRDDGENETLLASFFATAGTFDRPRAVASEQFPLGGKDSLSAEWTPPGGETIPRSGRVQIWCVLRDGRGGESVQSVNVTFGK
jgi:hypothetical protein